MAGEAIITMGGILQPATAVPQILKLRYAPDWIRIINITNATTPTIGLSYYYEWWGFMPRSSALVRTTLVTATASVSEALSLDSGIIYTDTSNSTFGVPQVATAISAAVPPRVTVPTTAGMTTGSTVRLTAPVGAGGGALQLAGMDATITVIDATHFDLTNFSGIVAAAAIRVQQIPQYGSFYPRDRFITKISQAAQAIVTFSVTHQYAVGDTIRFYVAPQYGMSQINGLSGTVVAVGQPDLVTGFTNTVTINLDTTGFTAFALPTSAVAAAINYQWAMAVPYGMDTATALAAVPPANILADAVNDQGFIGFTLNPSTIGGQQRAGGLAGDTILWQAGTGGLPND